MNVVDFKVNDYVLIKNDDKIYQIEAIEKNIAYLKGLTYRFQTTSLISELTVAPTHLVEKAIKKVNEIIDRFKIFISLYKSIQLFKYSLSPSI